jgi:hypothetical protein
VGFAQRERIRRATISHRLTLSSVTRQELYCQWAARHREQLLTTCRATLSPSKPAEQLSQQWLSLRLAQSFVAGRLVIGNNSSGVSQTKQLTCQLSLPLSYPERNTPSSDPLSDSPRFLSQRGSKLGAANKKRGRMSLE